MIDITKLVDDVKSATGLWCPAVVDDVDLAKMADAASNAGVGMVSVVPGAIEKMWPWLENQSIKIISRFYVAPARSLSLDAVSDLVKNIKAAFKTGADGAQVFVPLRLLADFAREMRIVRNDLFFNKDLIVGLDIGEIGPGDWKTVFDSLIDLQADSVLFVLTKDMGEKSDFPGRVYQMLNVWNDEYRGAVCWMLNDNFYRLEQAVRLTQRLRPGLQQRTKLLVNALDK